MGRLVMGFLVMGCLVMGRLVIGRLVMGRFVCESNNSSFQLKCFLLKIGGKISCNIFCAVKFYYIIMYEAKNV